MSLGARDRTRPGLLALLALGLGACAGSGPGEEPGRIAGAMHAEGLGCVVDAVPLTLGDDVFAYIEPEDLLRVGSSWVLVGSPSYTTERYSIRMLTRHRHLAARFGLDGRATLIERPVQDSVGSVRALPLDGERWGVIFDIERLRPSGHLWMSVSLWYAEHDGTRWSLLEPMPMPEDGELYINEATEVVRVGDELVWVAPVVRGASSVVVEHTRREGRWERRVIGDDFVEGAAMAYDEDSGLWMVRSGPNAELTAASLRLYHREGRGGDWRLVRTLDTWEPGELARSVGVVAFRDGVSVSWRITGLDDHGAYAWFGSGTEDPGTRIALDPEAIDVAPLQSPDGARRWIVNHEVREDELELRVFGPHPFGGAQLLIATPNPFTGFYATLATSSREVTILGADWNDDPADPLLRSLILRLSTSCS